MPDAPAPDLERRAAVHAALADPHRLAVVDALATSDRSPSELAAALGVGSNLLAHHLDVLERAGLVRRHPSAGDGRRRYLSLDPGPLAALRPAPRAPAGPVLFVCTHNSARSQLAAALWRAAGLGPAESAGTHPAAEVHPGAHAAARRAGLDLGDAVPRPLDAVTIEPEVVVTVCDVAHEEVGALGGRWLHWSVADPSVDGGDAAFDHALEALRARIDAFGAAA